MANRTKITRKKGVDLFKYEERIGGANVIFGEEDDSVFLGAFTLDALGLSTWPVTAGNKAATDGTGLFNLKTCGGGGMDKLGLSVPCDWY